MVKILIITFLVAGCASTGTEHYYTHNVKNGTIVTEQNIILPEGW